MRAVFIVRVYVPCKGWYSGNELCPLLSPQLMLYQSQLQEWGCRGHSCRPLQDSKSSPFQFILHFLQPWFLFMFFYGNSLYHAFWETSWWRCTNIVFIHFCVNKHYNSLIRSCKLLTHCETKNHTHSLNHTNCTQLAVHQRLHTCLFLSHAKAGTHFILPPLCREWTLTKLHTSVILAQDNHINHYKNYYFNNFTWRWYSPSVCQP